VYGTAHALRPSDWILTAYRETGAALYRGYPLRTFMCQMFGNAEDPVKGRQMPVHHTARSLNFVSISSPVGSQIPTAVGAAWAAKLQKKDDVAVGFFGEGATSTPTFHVSMNFAAVFKIPVILICRNNGWAISVPRSGQTASPTFAQKAIAYGMPGVLVDGNDILAMIHVVSEAAARARRGEGATLIEARTYRRGAHSTSDDPSVYRDPGEPKEWQSRDPLDRLRAYMRSRGELPDGWEEAIKAEADQEIRQAIADANRVPAKPPIASLFEDVYADVPWNLREQRAELEAELRKHGEKKSPHAK
jgi:pyruvate dehydrogenase E1 component alpha subunit